jgi:hypothetical protein
LPPVLRSWRRPGGSSKPIARPCARARAWWWSTAG